MDSQHSQPAPRQRTNEQRWAGEGPQEAAQVKSVSWSGGRKTGKSSSAPSVRLMLAFMLSHNQLFDSLLCYLWRRGFSYLLQEHMTVMSSPEQQR